MRHETPAKFKTASPAQLDILDILPRVKRQKLPPEIRFRKMLKSNKNGCIEFTGAIDPSSGYGRFRVDHSETPWLAHRFAYFLHHGSVPPLLRHRCNNTECCNPSHMMPGTNADNHADMVAAGRQRGKLKKEQVQLVVKLHQSGQPVKRLAERFSVSEISIRKLISGKTWSKVTGIDYAPKHTSKIRDAA